MMKRVPPVLLAICLILAAGVGTLVYQSLSVSGYAGKSIREIRSAPSVSASGGTWSVFDVAWQDWDGAWRVQADFMATRWMRQEISNHALLRSLCGALLTAMLEKPDVLVRRGNVFRVDVNILHEDVESGEPVYAFERRLPVPVIDGACQVAETNKKIYFPTYPDDLTGWELQELYLGKEDNVTRADVVFFWEADGKPDEKGFPYELACQAVLKDPYALEMFEEIHEANPEYTLAEAEVVRVRAKHRFGAKWLNVSKGGFVDFDRSGQNCLYEGEGETL